jgi:hypothetical protein
MKYLLLGLIFLAGCTDADMSNLTTLGSPAHIMCYSGNIVIYDGISTGKVATVDRSDGWQFVDVKTGKFMRVSGPCVIQN